MKSDPIMSFLSAFGDRGDEKPSPGRALFLGAQWHPGFDADWVQGLCCVQTVKPDYDRLAKAGFATVTESPSDRRFDLCLVRITKHKQESLGLIAEGLSHLPPGGALYVAGAKDEGIESIEKRLRTELGAVRTDAVRHSRTISLKRPNGPLPDAVTAWQDAARPQVNPDGFVTVPGIFSSSRIDRGSRLLIEAMPRDLEGMAADFGAGWGFLSDQLARRCPRLATIALLESDARALSCARINLSGTGADWQDRFTFDWCDIAAGTVRPKTYDLIVMNPPFHQGKETKTSLGSAFILAAATALKPGGKLYVVANRTLPYEKALQAGFSAQKRLADDAGFKVIEARR